MDEGNYGQDYQARLNAEAIARHRNRNSGDTIPNQTAGSGHVPEFLPCAWCEEEIPEARRLAVPGCSLCIGCQIMKERFPERIA
ncbi:MAG: TraR/DksA C4-type zinc finger protein [Deltaproteobacteria bacterium]|nr:TraR/DksA C4-type zinc finger protein [Deltaproteobacteria bacterium]